MWTGQPISLPRFLIDWRLQPTLQPSQWIISRFSYNQICRGPVAYLQAAFLATSPIPSIISLPLAGACSLCGGVACFLSCGPPVSPVGLLRGFCVSPNFGSLASCRLGKQEPKKLRSIFFCRLLLPWEKKKMEFPK